MKGRAGWHLGCGAAAQGFVLLLQAGDSCLKFGNSTEQGVHVGLGSFAQAGSGLGRELFERDAERAEITHHRDLGSRGGHHPGLDSGAVLQDEVRRGFGRLRGDECHKNAQKQKERPHVGKCNSEV